MKKKITELEEENAALRQENRYWKDKLFSKSPEALLPNTPVPVLPPPGCAPTIPPPGCAPALPPPRQNVSRNTNGNDSNIIDLDFTGPQISSKLEPLRNTNVDEIFDDNFDPRATEKDIFGLDPFNIKSNGSGPVNEKNHGDELRETIAECENK